MDPIVLFAAESVDGLGVALDRASARLLDFGVDAICPCLRSSQPAIYMGDLGERAGTHPKRDMDMPDI